MAPPQSQTRVPRQAWKGFPS